MHRRTGLVVGLLSLTVVGLELIWTRLFSAEFYYAFAFLALSLAVLGLGLGALALRLWPRLADERNLGWMLAATGAAALAGPPLVFRLGLDFSKLLASSEQLLAFVAALLLLGSAFLCGGMALGLLFRHNSRQMPRLYMADMAGAGAGVVLAVLLMSALQTPAATFLTALPVLGASWLCLSGWRRTLPATLATFAVGLAIVAPGLLQVRRKDPGPVTYLHWDAMAKLRVFDLGDARVINIDNIANTTAQGFDGDWTAARKEKAEFGIDVGYLIRRFPRCRFLSLGAGAGPDVLQALFYDAAEVHAVEVNPHINRMMLDDSLRGFRRPPADPAPAPTPTAGSAPAAAPVERPLTLAAFTGHLYRDPRVRVVTEDARAYVGRSIGRFDVIYSLSSNTFAALASGSFALAENYLFTTEAFTDYWRALSPGGFMVMEHQFYMPRLVGSLIDALHGEGVPDPERHFAVYDLPKLRRNLLLLSRQPLTDEIRQNAFGPLTPERWAELHVLYPADEKVKDNLVARIVRDGWRAAAPTAPLDISPATDDRPFVGQLGLWRKVNRKSLENIRMIEVNGFPLARLMIVTILGVVLALLLPLNLLPYLRSGPKLRAVPWLYFFAIGAAFMILEVVLIQKYTLFVGPSTHSIATVLLVLLLASGAGSRFATRFGDWTPFLAIAGWLLADGLLFGAMCRAGSSLPMAGRMTITAALVAPLGFFLGMPFPKATLRVGELVDWGFAVNGMASVLGGTGILLVAFAWGFDAALGAGAVLYLLAGVLLSARSRWTCEAAIQQTSGASAQPLLL
jgi:hypothetical protein